MQINSIKNLKLPSKKDEEFLKIDFETFFSKNFENIKINEFELENLSSGEDKNSYNSIFFYIAKSF
jgi:Fe-S cluster assembly protein SufD